MAHMQFSLATVRDVMGITPENLASIAGLKEEEQDPNMTLEIRDEMIKSDQEIFLGKLDAKYLPKMKAKFDEIDRMITPAMMLMNIGSSMYARTAPIHTLARDGSQKLANPYFVRFAKMSENASITPTHAGRLVNAPADFAKRENEEDVATACQFLSTLFALQGTGRVRTADKRASVAKLKQWKRTFAGSFAEETITRCLNYLSGDREMVGMTTMVGMMLSAPLEKCGFAGCRKNTQNIRDSMIPCDKCKTATYCSALHKSKDQANHALKCEVTY